MSQRIQRKLDGRVRHGVRRQKAQQCHAVRLFEPDLIPETMTKDDQRIDWVSNLGGQSPLKKYAHRVDFDEGGNQITRRKPLSQIIVTMVRLDINSN